MAEEIISCSISTKVWNHWCRAKIFKPVPARNQIQVLAWEIVPRSCSKPQNPRSNHEIHVLFEHDFYLKKLKLGPDLYA